MPICVTLEGAVEIVVEAADILRNRKPLNAILKMTWHAFLKSNKHLGQGDLSRQACGWRLDEEVHVPIAAPQVMHDAAQPPSCRPRTHQQGWHLCTNIFMADVQ